jgi:dihydropteroate synthase
MRPVFDWNLGSRSLPLGKRTLVMGIVNVTPDSFSDGGQFLDPEKAVARAIQMLNDGADIIDVGGESTRPGASVAGSTASKKADVAKVVAEEEELERVLPVIRKLKQLRSDSVISIDTYKASVARRAVEAGAEIVNDVSAFRWDPAMAKAVAELKCGAVVMHMRGRPEEWRTLDPVSDIVVLVKRELREWSDKAMLAGVKRERLVLDPGFGFGKNFDQNYPLLRRFDEFHQLRYPLLAGVSRKSFVGMMLNRNGQDAAVDQRLYATLATEAVVILKGAHIVRTHDVRASVEAARAADVVA